MMQLHHPARHVKPLVAQYDAISVTRKKCTKLLTHNQINKIKKENFSLA
jgi:hypothetical protein